MVATIRLPLLHIIRLSVAQLWALKCRHFHCWITEGVTKPKTLKPVANSALLSSVGLFPFSPDRSPCFCLWAHIVAPPDAQFIPLEIDSRSSLSSIHFEDHQRLLHLFHCSEVPEVFHTSVSSWSSRSPPLLASAATPYVSLSLLHSLLSSSFCLAPVSTEWFSPLDWSSPQLYAQ